MAKRKTEWKVWVVGLKNRLELLGGYDTPKFASRMAVMRTKRGAQAILFSMDQPGSVMGSKNWDVIRATLVLKPLSPPKKRSRRK